MTFNRLFFVFLFVSIVPLWASGQKLNPCLDEQPYEYSTNLKGGYKIVYKTRGEDKYLYLYKKNRRIREITGGFSCGLPHKNLGYVGADFANYFVLVHSFGSGNPHEVKLIRKRDGKNMFASYREACWIDASERHSIFLYSLDCVPDPDDKIVLMDLITKRKRFLDFPRSVFADPEVLRRTKIVSISKRELVLKFSSFGRPQTFTKRYRL